MILDQTLRLEIVLAVAVAANQPDVQVNYIDWYSSGNQTFPQTYRTATNSGTDVIILPAPTQQTLTREVFRVSVYNKDTASVTATIKTDDGTTERIIVRIVIPTLTSLHFEKNYGWYLG